MLSRAEEGFYQAARSLARLQAHRYGLTGDAVEELEQSFVVSWLLKRIEPPPWEWPLERRDPFLHRAARNHTVNFLRRLAAEQATVARYAVRQYGDPAALCDLAAGDPETNLFRRLFWQQINCGLHRLRPGAGDLFLCHYRDSISVEELQRRTGRSRHAIHQNLTHVRSRLRSVLAETGNSETELRSYSTVFASCPPQPVRPRPALDAPTG